MTAPDLVAWLAEAPLLPERHQQCEREDVACRARRD